VLVYNTERAKTKDQFSPVTDGQKQTIIAEIENSWVLDENSTASFFHNPLNENKDGSSYLWFNVMYGQNCIVRASIVQDVSIQGNIYKIYQYVWEIVVNKQHRVVVTTHSTGILYPESEKQNWEAIASAQTGAHVNFRFEIDANPATRYNGPRELWLSNTPPNPKAKADFKNGIIDEDISDNILLAMDVTVLNP
jgi:hypothetical protein